jgi:UrcA family protein
LEIDMKLPSIRLALALSGAVAGLALITPAIAQDDADITVRPPYVVHRHSLGRSAIGAREEEISVSRVVTTADLDLRSDEDVDELYHRVADTARLVCDEAGALLHDASVTSDRECVRSAMRDAAPQVRGVIAEARS